MTDANKGATPAATDADNKAAKMKAEADAKAQKEADKKAAAEKKAAEAKAKKEAADKAKADKKAAAEQAKKDAADKKEAEKQAKIKAAEDAKKAKEDAKQPEQNGIRRPDPNTQTGKVWTLADELSTKRGSPAAIADLLDVARKAGINDATTRTQYARWRKFYAVEGRVLSEADIQAAAAAEKAKADAAAAKAAGSQTGAQASA